MMSTRRGFMRGMFAVVAAASLPMMRAHTSPAQAAAPDATTRATVITAPASQTGTWEHLGPAQPVKRLFTPTSGALLASTGSALLRSDDAGTSWREVPLPVDSGVHSMEVDPNDHRVVYAASAAGVHRTDDEGASWSSVLPSTLSTLRIAVSSANDQILYVAQAGGGSSGSTGGAFAFRRSLDRGATWETLEETTQGPCSWAVLILQPHPTDPTRLFRTQGCYAGRNLGDIIEQSRDNAASFTTLFSAQTAFPQAIVGGGGVEPGRLYLSLNNDFRSGGSRIVASGDDGTTWTPILEYTGGGTMSGATVPSTIISGLAYDPAAPERVFVAQERKMITQQPVEASGVASTVDGGLTWAEIGQQDLPHINQLALGIDGLNLFAATEAGVWRLPLG